jgi:hypothetical protein
MLELERADSHKSLHTEVCALLSKYFSSTVQSWEHVVVGLENVDFDSMEVRMFVHSFDVRCWSNLGPISPFEWLVLGSGQN